VAFYIDFYRQPSEAWAQVQGYPNTTQPCMREVLTSMERLDLPRARAIDNATPPATDATMNRPASCLIAAGSYFITTRSVWQSVVG